MQAATTLLVNAGAGGAGTVLNPATYPSLSSNAQLIAFECRDSTLVTNDNNRFYDVFVRDLVAGTNELISAHYPGLPTVTPDALSSISLLSLSSNGQFLAFSSLADDLALYDTNGFRDIFFRDLIAGTNQLVSINTNGTGSGNSSSREPAISGNGRFVAFTSRASDLVAGDATNFSDVFVRDTLAGTTTLASVSTNGTAPGNNSSFSPVISTDGRYVMFHSQANNLAPGFSGGTVDSIFVRDLQAATTVALNTNTSSGNSLAAMTPDGRHVVYTASASIAQNLYVYDAQIGKRVYTNFVANAAVVGLSPNGNRIAYANSSQLLVADLVAHTNGMIGTTLGTTRSALRFSGDGRFLAYATTNAVWATDTNKVTDIYLYDFQLQTNLLISRSFSSGRAANGPSDSPDVSSDGRFIAYRSSASDIVPGDTNGVPDIFLYDRVLNTTRLITATPSGTSVANARSTTPVFSGDAQSLAFESWAANLTALDYNQSADVFLLVLSSSTITDSDGDGMDDAWEIQYFSTLDRDGTSDSDGDGVSDLVEFQTGTDPKDPASFFHVEVVSLGGPGQGATISWPATSGKTYQAQYKNSLNDSNWQNLSGNVVFVGNKGYANDPSPGGTQRFYRVVLSN